MSLGRNLRSLEKQRKSCTGATNSVELPLSLIEYLPLGQKRQTRRKMKIAILHSAFTESGGAERVVISQAKSLEALGHQVTCYVASINRKRCFPREIADIHIENYIFNMAIPKLDYLAAVSLISLVAPLIAPKLKGYDGVICHHQPSPWVAYQVFRKYDIPYISYMHHPPRFIYPRRVEKIMGWGHNLDNRILSFFEKRFKLIKRLDFVAVSNAKKVLVNSNNIGREVERIYGVKPIVCYPGVGLPSSSCEPSDDILKRLGISKPFILSTSRHTPHKRLDWLISMFSKIVEELPDVSLVLVGGFHPTYTAKLIEMGKSLGAGKVTFLNYVTDEELSVLYRAASVYAFTAPDEDFGLGPVEAMQYGTPVVCWDDGAGPSETVIDSMVGFKVKPYDLDEFAQKILRILQDSELRQNMGARAAVYASGNFNWDKHGKILEGVLQTFQRGAK